MAVKSFSHGWQELSAAPFSGAATFMSHVAANFIGGAQHELGFIDFRAELIKGYSAARHF